MQTKRGTVKVKRALVGVMVFAMLVGLLPSAEAQAAKKAPAIKSVIVKNGRKTVTKNIISLTVGKRTTLKVTVKPAKAKKSVAFKSVSPTVAKVNSKGTVTARRAGTTKITVTVRGKNGKKKTTFVKVKVKPKKPAIVKPETVEVESVSAQISNSQLTVGDTAQITAETLPKNATDRKLVYESSDTNVAAADQSGRVTAKAAGKATITVKSTNGKYAQLALDVKDKAVDVESVTMSILPASKVVVGSSAQLSVNVLPADATDQSIVYTSSDREVATVDEKGKVTAKAVGEATVKATASNGKSAQMTVTVLEKYGVQVMERTVEDGDDSIYGQLYLPDVEGTWPVVILSHGYNGNNTQFQTECRLFAEKGIMAYAYDFCGGSTVSKSSGKSTDMTIFTEKKNLLSVFKYIKELDNVDSEQIFLLGGSMGGLVTTLAAEELQGQVKAMVLYFPALNVADDWRKTFPTVDKIPETHEFWGLTLGREFFTSIHEFDPYEVIGDYSNEILIIWGDKDEIVPRSYVERAQQQYQKAKLIVVPGMGHDSSGSIFRESALSFMKEQLE